MGIELDSSPSDEGGVFNDGQIPWFKYALLSREYDTYKKGSACYEIVNWYFAEWHEKLEAPLFDNEGGDTFIVGISRFFTFRS